MRLAPRTVAGPPSSSASSDSVVASSAGVGVGSEDAIEGAEIIDRFRRIGELAAGAFRERTSAAVLLSHRDREENLALWQ